jgi:hypothetical protein
VADGKGGLPFSTLAPKGYVVLGFYGRTTEIVTAVGLVFGKEV